MHYDIHYPSTLNKLRKMFIKVVKMCCFTFAQMKKMLKKLYMRSIRSLRVGNCPWGGE